MEDHRVAPLIDAHHDTFLTANHALAVAAEDRSRIEGLVSAVDDLFRRTDAEEQKLDVLHRHELRLQRMERKLEVATFMRWLSHLAVPESRTISVVVPTRNRAHRLGDAVRSVQAQRYQRWELLIVDDGSTDDTPALLDGLDDLDDPRIRRLSSGGEGACAARNLALDHMRGDVVTYLDDDNRFDRLWLSAVAWAFEHRPDTTVAYGARIIDDLRNLRDGEPGGFPDIEFEPFDRATLERGNFVDCGVIAHRADPSIRFDPGLVAFGDWDLILQLTATAPPLELPAIAIHYTTDEPDRLSGPRNAYFLDEMQDEAALVRNRHRS